MGTKRIPTIQSMCPLLFCPFFWLGLLGLAFALARGLGLGLALARTIMPFVVTRVVSMSVTSYPPLYLGSLSRFMMLYAKNVEQNIGVGQRRKLHPILGKARDDVQDGDEHSTIVALQCAGTPLIGNKMQGCPMPPWLSYMKLHRVCNWKAPPRGVAPDNICGQCMYHADFSIIWLRANTKSMH